MPIQLGASTLGVTAFNVGMISETAYAASGKQDEKVAELAGHVSSWLRGEGPAVVGLNEIHTLIGGELSAAVEKLGLDVDMAQHEPKLPPVAYALVGHAADAAILLPCCGNDVAMLAQ